MAAHAEVTRTPSAFRIVTDGDVDRRSIALLDAHPSFEDVVPESEHALAAGVHLPLVELAAGDWAGPVASGHVLGSVVVDGFVVRTLHRYGRANVEMFGPGDLIASSEPEDGTAAWKVVQPTSLVALDDRFEIAARRWPVLWRVALELWSQRSERLAAHLAALQLSKVDSRIEAVLWQLADRFGKVTTDGVIVPVRLTHQTLGYLAAAKRPTVSVALAELAAEGRVVRSGDGWLLRRAGFGEADFETERRRLAR